MTPKQYAQKCGKSCNRIYYLLKRNRIPGAIFDEYGQWVIPDDAETYKIRPNGRPVKV
jgi:hypothetical protein